MPCLRALFLINYGICKIKKEVIRLAYSSATAEPIKGLSDEELIELLKKQRCIQEAYKIASGFIGIRFNKPMEMGEVQDLRKALQDSARIHPNARHQLCAT